ncbi:MAG: ABC transporter permease [Terriglobales bacterium]
MSRDRKMWAIAAGLVALHAAALFAGFLAPYDFATQNRSLAFVPPARLRFVDNSGRFRLRPFVYGARLHQGSFTEYEEYRSREFPLRFFVLGEPYKIFGMWNARLHLFGIDEPGRILLMGSDGFGRDLFSRLLYGSRISLFAGLLAAVLSLGIGLFLGAFSGFYGGWLDDAIMRVSEVFLALPWVYLLLALRAFLPLRLNPAAAFFLLIGVIGFVGWARPARLVRGVVLSARERAFVLAARGFGASGPYLLRRHALPQTFGILLTQAALLVPQYILAEVTLSFLGLGVAEPVPSWGNMLADLQQYHVLASYWWMLIPGFALVPVFLGYYALANLLHERVKFVVP